MDNFAAAAGAFSLAGLIAVYLLAVIGPLAGWGQVHLTRALAVALGIALAKGATARWDLPAIYLYAGAAIAAMVLVAVASHAHKRQEAALQHGAAPPKR